MMRRFAIAQFACRSRSVSGNDRTTDVKFVAEAVLDPAAETLGKIIS